MYYKVIKEQKTISVLDRLIYVKYQPKHKTLLLCDKSEAQGILAPDGVTAWHTSDCLAFPVDIFDTVTLVEIDQYEYNRLKMLNCMTAQEIAAEIMTDLIERGVL